MALGPRTRRLAVLGIATVVATVAASAAATPATAGTGEIRHAGGATAVGGSYVVVLKDGVRASAQGLTARHGGTAGFVYTAALRGFEVSASEAVARRIAADPAVDYVQQNHVLSLVGTQPNPPSWGLDRIDQRSRPLDSSYTYPNTASNVHAYIIDTGIRFTHTDFGGRATSGFDAIDGGSADDCHGHGTHVAGTTGGGAYGVAKGVQLVAVRVLSCSGSGTTAQVIAGVDWVTANAVKPAVANMSLGGGVQTALDAAVANSIASGVTYAIAAGNSNADACNFSPARVGTAITLGATDINDNRASFSNWGTCLDLFAPGVSIPSAWWTSDTATASLSGTSMASPHAAGAAALVASANPTWSPQQVRDQIVADATTGVVGNPGAGSPNRLLFVGSAPVGRTVSLRAVANGNYVAAESAGAEPLIANRTAVGQWETFDMIDLGGGNIALRAHANGMYVCAENAGAAPLIANRTAIGSWETFQLIDNGDGTVSFRAMANNMLVAAENAGAEPLIANRTAIGPWEQFYLGDV